MQNKVAAIVVTYNRKELLKECLTALLRQTYSNLDIFVIDNASSDGTMDYISDYIKLSCVFYYNTKKNIGGAGGFNFGMRLAAKEEYDYMWLMDDDTIPEDSSLAKLLDAAQNLDNHFGFLVSYAQFIDKTPCIMNIPDVKTISWIYKIGFLPKGIIEIERATFVSFLVPRKVVLKEGLPIKEFFIWADDTEYSKRIVRDFSCYFVSNSIVTHKVKTNIGASDDDFLNCDVNRLERYRFRFRNRFYIKKREGARAVLEYLAKFLSLNFKILRANDHRLKRLSVLWRGFVQGIFFNPHIESV